MPKKTEGNNAKRPHTSGRKGRVKGAPAQNHSQTNEIVFPNPLRQRRKGKGDLLYLNWPNGQGGYKKEYLGPWCDATLAEYRRRKKLFQLQGNRPDLAASVPNDPTIADLATTFMRWARDHYIKYHPEDDQIRPTGSAEKYFAALKPLVKLYGVEPIRLFTLTKFEIVQTDIDRSGRWCRSGVNECISRIKTVFRWGKRRKIVPADVCLDIVDLPELARGRCHSKDHQTVHSVAREQVEATLPFLSPTVADMVRMQLLTACRPEEIRIMRRCDCRPDPDSPGLWRYAPPSEKTEHISKYSRVIPLGPEAQKILLVRTCWMSEDSTEFVFRPVDSMAEWRLIRRTNRKTKPTPSALAATEARRNAPKEVLNAYFTKRAYAKAIERAALKAGVPHWTPYQLRHTAATEIERKYGWLAAQIMLGHRSPDTTKHYIDRDRSVAEDIAREIG